MARAKLNPQNQSISPITATFRSSSRRVEADPTRDRPGYRKVGMS